MSPLGYFDLGLSLCSQVLGLDSQVLGGTVTVAGLGVCILSAPAETMLLNQSYKYLS